MTIFGLIASILFIQGTVLQAYKSYKDGHSRGISQALIWSLIVGFMFMSIHVITSFGWDIALVSSLLIQLVAFLVIAKYKYFEKS